MCQTGGMERSWGYTSSHVQIWPEDQPYLQCAATVVDYSPQGLATASSVEDVHYQTVRDVWMVPRMSLTGRVIIDVDNSLAVNKVTLQVFTHQEGQHRQAR
jgi:hypothetical protein